MTQNEMIKEIFDSCCLSDFDYLTPEKVKEFAAVLFDEYNMDYIDMMNYDYDEMCKMLKELADQDRNVFYQKGVNVNE